MTWVRSQKRNPQHNTIQYRTNSDNTEHSVTTLGCNTEHDTQNTTQHNTTQQRTEHTVTTRNRIRWRWIQEGGWERENDGEEKKGREKEEEKDEERTRKRTRKRTSSTTRIKIMTEMMMWVHPQKRNPGQQRAYFWVQEQNQHPK